MKIVTKTLAVFLMMFGVVKAQLSDVDVTLNFDATQLITNCMLEPTNGGVVNASGSFNGWGDGDAFTKATGSNVYSLTKVLKKKAVGDTTYNFKLRVKPTTGGALGWEDDPNRSITLTPTSTAQTVDLGAFKGTISNQCAPTDNVEVLFKVNMYVQRIGGNFNQATEEVRLAGDFTAWDATGSKLMNASLTPDVFEVVHQFTGIKLGVAQNNFKYIIAAAGAVKTWEGGSNKNLLLPTTGLTDPDNNTFKNYTFGEGYYFDGVTPNDVFTANRTCYLELDGRPAYYRIVDSGSLPATVGAGGTGVTALTGFFINGPLGKSAEPAGSSVGEWQDWGDQAGALGTSTVRRLTNTGTDGDTSATDSIFTVKIDYLAGKPRKYVGKFGANGFDNAAPAQSDLVVTFPDAANCRVRSAFGLFGPTPKGKLGDDIPSATAPQAGPYDNYINITHAVIPGATAAPYFTSTWAVVRRGGDVDGIKTDVERTSTEIPTAVELGKAYPNPFNTATSFEYKLAQDEKVSIKVYDMMGRVVATLVDGEVQTAGTYKATLNAEGLASGMYIYRLETGATQLSGKMMIVK